ncbi:hypothetical protein POMI540_3441 [Schizosaccharomyces pombe]|uniref:UPF0768 protein C1952.04c n=1 Tax=Schizosaccharomyces pombe (strain 972 / ATCC 24843) TaxID=284812 RepID=YLO4_SCHPO|nr:uncharacterized protein SPAC1952.04c [Schizosaccharomyces pombe]Q8J1M8.2 RecName: Full=UPF0768 protein C1952.04c [Schizosaccharomyces pombe 972h-]CAD47847.2 conserved fungal protein [Schizosaccharomyces pombe]|eukprot:NP_001018291.2 uncharacterized protein SPAC1952.04c [Schizosaccharomyces pombe]
MFLFLPIPLNVQDIWKVNSKYKHVLLTCPVCQNKTVRVYRLVKSLALIVLPVLPVYTSKVLRCSHCGWYEPVDSAMIDQRRRREDLPTPERPEASAQQHAFFPGSSSQQTDIPNVRPQPHIPPPRKSDEAPPPYSYK